MSTHAPENIGLRGTGILSAEVCALDIKDFLCKFSFHLDSFYTIAKQKKLPQSELRRPAANKEQASRMK